MEFVIIALLVIISGLLLWDRIKWRQTWKEQGDALTRTVGEKIEGSMGVFGDVREKLGELAKRTRDIEEVGKSITGLQEALRAPKFRGGFGELGLERLLEDSLPSEYFSLQHRFQNGEIVDAVVRIGGNLVPIDAKFPFPLDDFERMVTAEPAQEQPRLRRQFIRTIKKHIDDISKYILPDEKTFDFALMYIPAENVYYEAVVRCPQPDSGDDIYRYCLDKRVFPVSPNSFYAYLQVITLGLKGLQIEKSAREILGRLERLHHDLRGFQDDYEVVGRHISNASKKYADAETKLTRLSSRFELITGEDQPRELPDVKTETPDGE
jgi:DNA recombination protein RmuC